MMYNSFPIRLLVRISRLTCLALALVLTAGLEAQVYSPTVLRKGQVDTSNLTALAQGIYAQTGAVTDRQKAEAIWRFFLTDGRFVKPGFWYHIAGWAYEEPLGEVLDPLELLNSYGFGLCYHIAPLLEAVWEAGGFPRNVLLPPCALLSCAAAYSPCRRSPLSSTNT